MFSTTLPEMTSVLYSAGLNYQNGNPIHAEFNKINAIISELRKSLEASKHESVSIMRLLGNIESKMSTFESSIAETVSLKRIVSGLEAKSAGIDATAFEIADLKRFISGLEAKFVALEKRVTTPPVVSA
jgi:hypothetical protein